MIYLSLEKFIKWIPFLIIGLITYYITLWFLNNHKRKFWVHKTLYYRIAELMIPLNLFSIVSIDTYFLFYGRQILIFIPSTVLLSVMLSMISFAAGLTSISSVFTIYLSNYRRIIKKIFEIIIPSFIIIIILSFFMLFKLMPLFSIIPILSFFLGGFVSIVYFNRKFNPYEVLFLPFILIVFSITYIIFVIINF